MEATGRIKKIFDERWLKENFTIREFVLTLEENTAFPQTVVFQLINNNCDHIIGKHVGDVVTVQFNLRGKYGAPPIDPNYNHLPYNRLEVWNIRKTDAE